MNKILFGCLMVAVLAGPAAGQKVETHRPDSNQVFQVRTALHHLTVIEMGEPVLSVAVGSPAFKVEWRENRVFIQPTEPNAGTNLFVWTASARFNYELRPAGSVEEMHFAIDQSSPDPVPSEPLPAAAPEVPTAREALLKMKPIRTDHVKLPRNRVGVLLTDSFQFQDQLLIRFTIRNHSKRAYAPDTPHVIAVVPGHFRQSLYSLSNSQLDEKDAARLKAKEAVPLVAFVQEIRSVRVEPGQETVGIVGVRLPDDARGPLVLRILFPSTANGPVVATLVR